MESRRTPGRADSIRRPGRRQFLGALGALAAIGLAGCSGSGDDGEGDGGSGGDGGSDGDGGDGGDGDGGSGDGDGGEDGAGGAVTDPAGDGSSDDGGSGDGESNADGGSDPGVDDADDESGDGSASDLACADLTAGYTAYSGGGGDLFSDLEIPTVLAESTEVMPVQNQVWVRAVRPLTADGDAQFHLSITQGTDGQETARGLLDIEEAVTEIEYEGETLTVSKMAQTDFSGVEQLRVSLPYDGGDGTRYYPLTVQLEVENAPGGEVSEACDAAIDEAARHVMESLQPNPDTAFGGSAATALSPELVP